MFLDPYAVFPQQHGQSSPVFETISSRVLPCIIITPRTPLTAIAYYSSVSGMFGAGPP